jgi:hypothetical protein
MSFLDVWELSVKGVAAGREAGVETSMGYSLVERNR